MEVHGWNKKKWLHVCHHWLRNCSFLLITRVAYFKSFGMAKRIDTKEVWGVYCNINCPGLMIISPHLLPKYVSFSSSFDSTLFLAFMLTCMHILDSCADLMFLNWLMWYLSGENLFLSVVIFMPNHRLFARLMDY